MIPTTLHYIWFGNTPKSDELLSCIESWKQQCPNFVIKEWNELTFPVEQFPFASRMYNEKRWAFVADYARLQILYEEGGFYLDTDMLLVGSLERLTDNACVLGEEAPGTISAGMIGSIPHHPFIKAALDFYNNHKRELITIPRVLSSVYSSYEDRASLSVCPPNMFYPFDAAHIKNYKGQDLGPEVIGVHLWHYSWGHPLNKLFKKLGIHSLGTRTLEILGLKNFFKKLLGFI